MNPKWKMILKKAGLICLSTILFALCSVLIYITKVTGNMRRLEKDPELPVMTANPNLDDSTKEKLEGYWTVAVFGVDSRDANIDKGTNADVQMICSINRATGDIRLVSVFRDTYLMNDIVNDTYGKVNQAYFEQGAAGNAAVLGTNLDITIDDYAAFHWKAVVDAINLLGGVEMDLTKAEFYYINAFITETVSATGVASTHLDAPGMQHLDGVQAVAYMRLRLMDTDYNRTERQRKVIEKVLEKAKNTDVSTLLQVIDTVVPQIGVSMDVNDLIEIARNIKKYKISATTGFPFEREEANMGRKGACVIPNTLESNVKELHRFFYSDEAYICSDRVREISREIIKDAVKN